MLYYPYKMMFSVQISDCFSMCLRFVCKQSDKNHSVHGWLFLAVIFRCFFIVWWLYLEINQSLVAEISCTNMQVHSFVPVHNTTFQIKTVFNNVLFSTEVHNPLYVHLLALSHIYVSFSMLLSDIWSRSNFWVSACFLSADVSKTIDPLTYLETESVTFVANVGIIR